MAQVGIGEVFRIFEWVIVVSSATNWWLRSANTDNANNAMNVNSDGTVNNNNAYNANGVAPIWFEGFSILISSIPKG